jgi:hypothetical protein
MTDKTDFPNLFVPGFAKSGTSHLCVALSESDDIFLPKEKEPHYFADDVVPDGYRTDRSSYLDQYCKAQSRYRLDGSISYLYSQTAMSHIAKTCAHPKFIVMVRHPFDRMMSHYKFNVRNSVEKRPFPQAILNAEGLSRQWVFDYRSMSNYTPQIARMAEVVDLAADVRFIDYGDYRHDPGRIVSQIAQFLNVDIPITDRISGEVNVSRRPKVQFVNDLISVDTSWKKVAKSFIPFKARRAFKKYVHRVNISDQEIVCAQNSYTDDMRAALDLSFANFKSAYGAFYL